MAKRRNINLLPPVHQTDELKRFFGSTVDQLFQPGKTDLISGYIGRKPSYFDATKDFYKVEATPDRIDRQLEPAVVSVDEAGAVNTLVFYDDFVNHLRAAGAPTDSMDRLLASQRYSWAPPVDLDKLLNFHNYYWVAADTTPTTVRPPSRTYTAGSAQLIYALPPAISAWGGRPDSVIVTVNNSPVVGFTVTGGNVILTSAPTTGATVKVTRYADLITTMTGMETAINPSTGLPLTSGQLVRIIDSMGDEVYWVEGVGRSISFMSDIEDYDGDRPYIVIDRTCRSRNVWSRRNRWAHRSVLPDAAIVSSLQAARPILEFEPNMVLFNYGTYRLPNITCTLSTTAIKLATSDVAAHAISVPDINGLPLGTVKVDGDHLLVPGDRLLVRQTIPNWSSKTFFAANTVVYYQGNTYRASADHVSGNTFSSSQWSDDPLASINNQIFVVEEVEDGNTSVYGLLIQTDSEVGAVVKHDTSETEYWFNGATWPVAQAFSAAPLFDLFDKDGLSFSSYSTSSFEGSKVFAYALGNGTEDTYIGQSLKYNEYGQIVFENQMNTLVLESDGEVLDVARFYARDVNGTKEFENAWHVNSEDIQLFDGQIPINLQANPDNQTPDFISRNQWFEHFSQILTGQDDFTGEPYSINNWRDTARDLGRGRCVLQHNASMIRPMVLASSDTFNVIDAILQARNEYETFIAKFLRRFDDMMNSAAISPLATTASWVDSVLTNLIVTKQSDYAFALSGMAGGQYFIPPTPTYLGLLPAFTPKTLTQEGIHYIQGHDGSLRPLFNDNKDLVLLELESRIYASIRSEFKTEDSGFSLSQYVAGYFGDRLDSQFTRDEYLHAMAARFEHWCQIRSVDYRTNDMFSSEDRFTWNYSSIMDSQGRYFDGHWRGIYRYVYGTDRPHIAPWEMLGFGDKPVWWEGAYGPAPYTSGNIQMWGDIQEGRILEGPRAGISLFHMRPGLLPVYSGQSQLSAGHLPVDESGALLDPIAAHVVPHAPNGVAARQDWKFGDGGDVETLWMQSAGYCFDLCIGLYLLRPIAFIEQGWDSLDEIIGPNGQPISKKTGKRPHMSDIVVHGERVDGVQFVAYGVQQWVSDNLIVQGRSPSELGDVLRRSTVRLAHRVAGFTTTDNMNIATDNFGLIPQEDIQIILHQSKSTREEFYSGMVVEWTGSGYRIYGFDPAQCFFSVFEADENAKKTKLLNSEKNGRAINPWRPSTYYATGTLVSYDEAVYGCTKNHTSATKFEGAYWEIQPARSLPDVASIYAPRFSQHIKRVPYGTVLTSRQDVVNVILGYGAYLRSRGWVFEASEESGVTDWMASARSFANWSILSWEAGYFVALSPAARAVTFTTETGTILNVEQTLNGFYGLYDRAGQPIAREISIVNRSEDDILITAGEADIYGARVRVADIEHALVFSNTTIFGDIIYEPLYNLRQPRLKANMLRATEWKGRFDAPGYLIVDGEIKPSFEKSAENLRTMFDIEHADDPTLRDYARHLIGFQKRDYLTALNLSDTQQFEFYQGLIQNKGSVGAFDRLLRSNIIGQNRNLQFREEWAVRVGEYGANLPFYRWEIEVRKDDILNQNQFFYFDASLDRDDWANLQQEAGRWVSTPKGKAPTDFAFTLTTDQNAAALPSAGYVRTNEVSFIAKNMASLENAVLDYIAAGKTLTANMRAWILDDVLGEWSVFKFRNLTANGTPNRITSVINDVTDPQLSYTRVYCEEATGLTTDDIGRYAILLDTLQTVSPISGIVLITDVDVEDESFTIDTAVFQGVEYDDADIGPMICILEPMRFASLALRSDVPSAFWAAGDLAYVDDNGSGNWTVYSHDGTDFSVARIEGPRAFNEEFKSSALYHLGTEITSKTIAPQPLVLDHISLIDYRIGAIPGAADRDLSFKLEYDPAVYTGDSAWGENEVGKLWWDLSAVRFLDPYTDDLERDGITDSQFATELEYRLNNWCRVAPETSVDVYEWVRSEVNPEQWVALNLNDPTGVFAGQVYLDENAPFITRDEYSARYRTVRTFYYFWVKNRLTVPNNPSRALSSYACAQLIENPSKADIVWIAPISRYGMLFSNAAEYLDSTNTVLQLDFEANAYDGPVHHQWALIRVGDEESIPPARVWTKIIDSLVGFDLGLAALPDPALHVSAAVGSLEEPRQNIFSRRDDDLRLGITDARRSCIEMVNYILARHDFAANHATEIEDLFAESPLTQRLAWVQADNSTYVEPLPPSTEYDIMVHSIEERDEFFTNKLYTKFITPGPWDKVGWELTPWDADFSVSPRILLNGLASERPFWSVWQIDLDSIPDNATKADLEAGIDDLIIATPTFDHEVTSLAARDALPGVESGDRVLVRDTSSSEFWTIWAYFENASEEFDAGYNLVNAQRYRTADFLEHADWYADGYDSTRPPVIRYGTVAERNAVERDEPTSVFVRVDDDGFGNWMWTAYDRDDNSWNIVARQNGTIQLSTALYDYSRPVYGWNGADADEFDPTKVANRDGSFELRILLRMLQDKQLISNLEINELFFSLAHFIHSQQDQVDWLLPTSYMSVIGYKEPLRASAIATSDNIDTILQYLDEVKPYRVKTRDFVRGLISDDDSITGRGTDFDKPIYYDPASGRYRPLKPGNSADAAILDTLPWADWSENPASDMVRRITGTVTYDRVWPNISEGDASGAAKYIDEFYEPSETMPEKSFSTLLDLDFKGTIIDARREVNGEAQEADVRIVGVKRDDADVAINGATDLKFSFSFQDAYLSANKPEELCVVKADDALVISITENWGAGVPKQRLLGMDTSALTANTLTSKLDFIPQNKSNLAVFQDGVRISNSLVTFDQFAGSLLIPLTKPDTSRVNRIAYRAIGYGATTTIISQKFFISTGLITVPLSVPANSRVVVEVNGVSNDALIASTTTSSVTFTAAPANGAPVVLTVLSDSGNRFSALNTAFSYTASKTWTLAASGTNPLRHTTAIVEKNGIRLTPPKTYYGQFGAFNRAIPLVSMPSSPTSVEVWLNGVLDNTKTQLVDGVILPLSPSYMCDDVRVVVRGEEEFDLVDTTLSVPGAVSGDQILVTGFSNDSGLNIRTHVQNGIASGEYLVAAPLDQNYVWVTVNGVLALEGFDYVIEPIIDAYDTLPKDFTFYDDKDSRRKFKFLTGHTDSDRIVVTTFGTNVARPPALKQLSTKSRSTSRHEGSKLHVPAWEFNVLNYEQKGGTLTTRLDADSTTITIQANPNALPSAMVDASPFAIPDTFAKKPGVIWVGGERIEYFSIEKSNDIYTLGELRRGTQRTFISNFYSIGEPVYSANVQTTKFDRVI